MKTFFTLFAAMLACLFQFAAAGDDMACSKKNGDVVNALGKFCQNSKLVGPIPNPTSLPPTNISQVVPSKYSKTGMYSDNKKVNIWISGSCGPAQWVPQEYCFSQFYHLCATGDKYGQNHAYYGRNNCQSWHIVQAKK